MNYQRFWKVWLTPLLFTKDVENDYVAEVSTSKQTLNNEDLARRIVLDGSEYKYDTLLAILNRADEEARQALMEGFAVKTGNVMFTPRVKGVWIGTAAKYDPNEHKLTCDAVLTKAMRDALQFVGIEILGVKNSSAYIGLVTNGTTGLTDGEIYDDHDIIIDGGKIKIAPDDDPTAGVFLIDEQGNEYKVTQRLTQNDPKRIICRVPALAEGLHQYRLQVRTRFSTSKTLLKEMRTIEYEMLLSCRKGEL